MFGWPYVLGHEIEFAWRLKSTPIETRSVPYLIQWALTVIKTSV